MSAPTMIAPEISDIHRVRFFAKVKKGLPNECWPWTGGKSSKYGKFRIGPKKYQASVIAYFLATGNWPAPLCVCHTCDNPPCCNPKHFFLGTHGDNAKDSAKKGRKISGDKHWTRINPERVLRGDRHPSRINPEINKRPSGILHPNRAKGESHGKAKVTKSQVIEIRSLHGSLSYSKLAARFGVSKQQIYKIIRNKNWD